MGSWIKDFTNVVTRKSENGSCFGCLTGEIVTPRCHPRREKLGAFGSFWVHPSRARKHHDQPIRPSEFQWGQMSPRNPSLCVKELRYHCANRPAKTTLSKLRRLAMLDEALHFSSINVPSRHKRIFCPRHSTVFPKNAPSQTAACSRSFTGTSHAGARLSRDCMNRR